MNESLKKVLAFFFLITVSVFSFAQETREVTKDSLGLMKWFSKSFVLERPDTSFSPLSDGMGILNKKIGATIKILTYPGKYNETKKEFLTAKNTENSFVIDNKYHKVHDKEAF